MRGVTASLPGPVEQVESGVRGTCGSSAPLRAGSKLGAYELLAPIAAGGMAQVWIARRAGALGFSRLVAVKTIRPEHAHNSAVRAMFLEEARIAARLRHTNLVEVLDLGEHGSIVFQVMTLVDGDSLSGLTQRWQMAGNDAGLPPELVLRIIADACRGLHAAHELRDDDGAPLQLVHRDISPQNILIGLDGVAKVADFGIAKALGRLTEETEVGERKGKLAYMSPEQAEGRPLSRQSDVFSAGIVLWEMLAGKRLFRAESPAETLERVLGLPIPDPCDLPAPVLALARRALARDPDQRFASAEAMADAAEAAATQAGMAVTARDVASLVRTLAGKELAERRESVRTALEIDVAEGTVLAAPSRRRFVIGGAIGLVAIAVLGFALAGIQRTQSAAAATPTSSERQTGPSPSIDDTAASPTSAAPSSTTSSAEAPRAKANPQGRRPKAAAPTTKSRPPFGNPYD